MNNSLGEPMLAYKYRSVIPGPRKSRDPNGDARRTDDSQSYEVADSNDEVTPLQQSPEDSQVGVFLAIGLTAAAFALKFRKQLTAAFTKESKHR